MLSGVKSHFSKIGDFLGFWGHFCRSQNRGISGISKPIQYFDSHSKTKNGSGFVEVSIESSDFRAFDRALNEGATYFSFQVMSILAPRKCYFLGPKIFKMSQLSALRRRLLKIKKVCPPPQKVVSKILEPDVLEVIRAIFQRYKVGPNRGVYLKIEITRLYP